jgi:hypothetical protein
MDKAAREHRSRQLNPNNDAYWRVLAQPWGATRDNRSR